jgi:voltage-gated potassium channel Kch
MPTLVPAIASILLLLLVLHDAFEVMLLPRRIKSRLRLVRLFFRFTWLLWSKVARRIASDERRHNYLSLYGPLSMVWLLMVWASGLITGFGTLYWAIAPGGHSGISWPNELYFSGVTFFTVGYGDLVPHTSTAKLLVVLEAGTGLGFIAIVIGYLPVLYQLFARREAKVIILDAVAGSPPSALTLLLRHADAQSLPDLDNLFQEWQQWSAELMESQLSYPMLAFYRSQHDNQSWLATLTTIMDSCALVMAGFKGVRTFRARLAFSTARQAVVEMGRVFQVGVAVTDNDRLPADRFERLRLELELAGLEFSETGERTAEQRLYAFRQTYEPFLTALADYLVLTLPDWLPTGSGLDNWQNNPRGRTAKQLMDSVPAKPE